jgi:hypothetical protein
MGKYSKVLRQYGKAGFGVPSKAPQVGSFPLYPLSRARYALTILASPNYDSKTGIRAKVSKRAIALHPSLRSYWSQLNRETIKPRMASPRRRKAANPRRKNMARFGPPQAAHSDYSAGARQGEEDFDRSMDPLYGVEVKTEAQLKRRGESPDYIRGYLEQIQEEEREWDPSTEDDLYEPDDWLDNPRRKNMSRYRRNYGRVRLLRNPDGMPLGKGTAVRVPGGKRSHILNERSGYALCGAGKLGNLQPSAAKTITCYRCIKIRIVDSGDDVERMLPTEPGKRKTHMMVPGGRQGRYVSGVKPSDVMHGEEMFVGGTLEHPSQTRLLSSRQKAKRLADIRRKRSRKVAPGRRVAARGEMVANPRSYKQGYQRGSKDYRSTAQTPASQLKQRTESYQFGYLEGYADAADNKNTRRRNTKRRRNTRRRR